MKIGALDPPYHKQAKKHYGDHPDFAGEVDHRALLIRAMDEFDGWFLHMSSPSVGLITGMADDLKINYRMMAWVKLFAAFKANVPVAYAWEPVMVVEARKPEVSGRIVMRDWFAESITMQRGLSGAKPEMVSRWLFEVVGAKPGDELVDVFPGTGAIMDAWKKWRVDVLMKRDTSVAADRFSRLPKWAQMEMLTLRAMAGMT